jgi:putative transcription antitermination factor YqgF
MRPDKSQSPRSGPALELDAFHAALAPGARLIGIDVGTKTLGLALSDVLRTVASPLETIRRRKFSLDAARLIELAAEHQIGGFVIGLPANLDGSEGPRAQSTRAFARNLANLTPLPRRAHRQTRRHHHPANGSRSHAQAHVIVKPVLILFAKPVAPLDCYP